MSQTNLTSGNRRDVRRCIGSSDYHSFKRAWQDTQDREQEPPRARIVNPNATEQPDESDATESADLEGMEFQEVNDKCNSANQVGRVCLLQHLRRLKRHIKKTHWVGVEYTSSNEPELRGITIPLTSAARYKQTTRARIPALHDDLL